MKRLFLLAVLIAAMGYAALYFGYLHGPNNAPEAATGGRRGSGESAVAITAADIKTADMPVTLDAIGSAQALNTVTVKPQVDGKLIKIAFTEGQDVKAGDVLALIDPTTYQAQYDQAVAKKAQDSAQLANARTDLERYQKLLVGNFGSQQQADTQKALVAQLEAQVRQDQAAVDNAHAILNYTTIRSPIDGRTGIRLVDEGNILQASGSTGIVVIAQIKPIAVIFNMAQQNLAEVNAALAKGPLSVQALNPDNSKVIEVGNVVVVDNQVDPNTGTVKIKAVFSNADISLWPGQFVNVRLTVRVLKNAVVAPTAAIQRGPNGAYVFVVQSDGTVAQTNVTVAQQNENEAVVATGLTPPVRVATSGFARLTNGAKVRVADSLDPQDPAAMAQDGPKDGTKDRAEKPADGPSKPHRKRDAQTQ